ncbi:MAG: DUF6477 family protein [Pseudomonadota bacterium]
MQDIFTIISGLRRPRLLITAARHGVDDYNRKRALKRLLGVGKVPGSGPAAMRLLELERSLNEARVEGQTHYDALRHIEVLIAIMGEARLLAPKHRA